MRLRALRLVVLASVLAAPSAYGAEQAPLRLRIFIEGVEQVAQADEREVPGRPRTFPESVEQMNEGAVRAPPPEAFPVDQIPLPDRWRLVDTLGVVARWFDPYNQNVLKGDRPLEGTEDWFVNLTAISDTLLEPRSFPTPVGVQTTQRPGSLDAVGQADSLLFSQTILLGASFIQGSTAFKPPELEFRVALAYNYNYVEVSERRVLSVNPGRPPHRHDSFLGVQEAFLDYHLRNVSERYDFDSIRIGIQPFSSDFRGFLFQDNQLGIRLFGDRLNNRYQYNLAFFARLEKDTNSGLNDIGQGVREDYVAIANGYAQDFPIPGFTSQIVLAYNRNREAGEIHVDDNGFPARPALIGNLRPRDYDVVYLGYNGDGHIGRVNLTVSAYGAFGEDRDNIFTGRAATIQSWFIAAEPSYDFSWVRVRLSGLYASGDSNPYDGVEGGFDAVFENPQFAGADTSYWIRQSIPFIGGGRAVFVNSRNGILNSLRSSKEEGQSNFNNPGTILLGGGADFDLLPELRISANMNHIWFADVSSVKALRQEASIPHDLGWDYSLAATWRPRFTQNIVFRGSAALLAPGEGFGDLFSNGSGDDVFYSMLFNAILTF